MRVLILDKTSFDQKSHKSEWEAESLSAGVCLPPSARMVAWKGAVSPTMFALPVPPCAVCCPVPPGLLYAHKAAPAVACCRCDPLGDPGQPKQGA